MRFAALCLLLLTTLSCQAADHVSTSPAVISVSGQGVVTAAPDMATIMVGVTTQAEDAASAVAANNTAMTSLNKALNEFGIEERDRRSLGFNVQPRYDHRRNASGVPEIVGFTVSNQVTVRVRKLDDLGDLLGAVVKSGSNTINSLSFGNSNADELRDEARKLAVENALHKASLYAEAAGGQVGRIVSITESGAPRPYPDQYVRMNAGFAAEAMSVPVAPGESELSATVNVVFEFNQ